MEPASTNYVYHGGERAVSRINPNQVGQDGELLCASRSLNVARRYGDVISRFTINDIPLKRISIKDWLRDTPTLDEIRKEGFSAVIVTGEAESYDFPVDMIVALDVSALLFDRVLQPNEILVLDDGLALRNDPTGPADVGWDLWVQDFCSDENSALTDLGWTVFPDGRCQVSVPEDDFWREYTVTVIPGSSARNELPGVPSSYWNIANNYGCGDGMAATRAEALAVADQWRLNEIERRSLDREKHLARREALCEDDFCVPF